MLFAHQVGGLAVFTLFPYFSKCNFFLGSANSSFWSFTSVCCPHTDPNSFQPLLSYPVPLCSQELQEAKAKHQLKNIWLSIHPSIHSSNCPPIHPPIPIHPTTYPPIHPPIPSHPSIHPSTHPFQFIYPSIHPPTHSPIPIHLSTHSSTHPYPAIYPSIHPLIPINPSIHPSILIHPSVHPSIHPLTHSHSYIYPPIHPSAHPPIHPPTHPLNNCPLTIFYV